MFSKAKDKNAQEATANGASADASSGQNNASMNSSKRSNQPKPAGVPSIISSDVVMTGNINAAGEVQFDGSLEGDIKAVTLIVGEKANVKGEIICDRVTVRGKVEGGIRAKQVSLAATAHINGDIIHSSLSVENGAHFEGACRHSDDPLSEASSRDFRKQRPLPSTPTSDASSTDSASMREANGSPASRTNDAPSFLSTSQGRSPLR